MTRSRARSRRYEVRLRMHVPPPGEKPRTPLDGMAGASARGSMLAAAAAAANAEEEEEEQDPLADWSTLLAHLRPMMDFIDKCVDAKRKLLLHCDTGISTSFCVLLVYMLTKRRVRLSAAIEHVQKIRKQCALTEPLAAGLDEMQSEMDSRKLRRLEDRLRNSTVLSLGF